MGDIQVLIDMGFSKDRAEYAIRVTNDKGVEPAMEWLLAHADESIPSTSDAPSATLTLSPLAGGGAAAAAAAGGGAADAASAGAVSDVGGLPSTSDAGLVAKSLKCDECQKILKDQSDAEYHAAKTGHSNFSESGEEKKPLTDEERKEQLAMIEEKLKQKRIEREERDKQDALERERNRIKSGKDMTEARKRMEEIEMQKIMDQRKREKAEEKAARDRVRAQIEADKQARKQRDSKSQHSPVDASPTSSVSAQPIAAPNTPATPLAKPKEYTETRIQIRLQDGSLLQEKFNVREQLSAVRTYIQIKTGTESSFGLMTTFPRKVFEDEHYDMPLEVLGLVPSAVLTVTKSNPM